MAATSPPSTTTQPWSDEKLNLYSSDSSLSWRDYERLRPAYPAIMFDLMSEYMAQHNHTSRELCIDYGSGSGVIVPKLLDRCGIKKVLRTDLNERQLEEGDAKLKPQYGARVESMVGAAGSLDSIEDASVDFVTAAEACHYFNRPKWLEEVARVLRPSGTLAIIHYRPQCFIVSHPEAADHCNYIFAKLMNLHLSHSPLMVESGILSATLLDSVVVDPSSFHHQQRIKWFLPDAVSRRVSQNAEYCLREPNVDQGTLEAGLRAAPDLQYQANKPADTADMIMRSEKWTTSTLVQYARTLVLPMDKLLADDGFRTAINEIERIVGGPEGTFDVGWSAALLLATRS